MFRIFDGLAEEATSRYYDRFIEIKAHFSTAIFSETKSVTPIFFFIFGVSTL